jgi:cell wall-associated NlpC family hydrolase
LRSKPYRYGGGHALFRDRGYDCSGTVSYALGGAGLVSSPMSSSDFRRYGQRGQGRWITVYTRNGHTFAVIRRFKIGYNAWRHFPVSLGAALANDFSGSGWI